MRCPAERSVAKKSNKFPRTVCSKGVGSNSIRCTKCKKWVHKNCSGVKGRLKADNNYQCLKCQVNGKTTIEAGVEKNLLLSSSTSVDCVEEFCYLWDMLSSGGGAGEASRVRIRCAWKKFRELSNTNSKGSISDIEE